MRQVPSEGGASLVELLLAITILGIVSVGMMSSLATMSISADRTRRFADGGSVIVSAADALGTLPYDANCPATYTLKSAVAFTSNPNMRVGLSDVTISSVAYWDHASATFTPTCVPSLPVGDPRRLQLVTLDVVSAVGRGSRTLQVVKRG